MMKRLKLILIWISLTVFAAIISYIVWKYLDSWGDVRHLLIETQGLLLILITQPTPLWATIALIAICCLYTYRKARSYNPPNVKSKVGLSLTAVDILTFFGKQDNIRLTTDVISKTFDLSFNTAQLAIDQLLHLDLLYSDTQWGVAGEFKIYWLSTEGRAFLGKEKLL